jgi:hypothetical protein
MVCCTKITALSVKGSGAVIITTFIPGSHQRREEHESRNQKFRPEF